MALYRRLGAAWGQGSMSHVRKKLCALPISVLQRRVRVAVSSRCVHVSLCSSVHLSISVCLHEEPLPPLLSDSLLSHTVHRFW